MIGEYCDLIGKNLEEGDLYDGEYYYSKKTCEEYYPIAMYNALKDPELRETLREEMGHYEANLLITQTLFTYANTARGAKDPQIQSEPAVTNTIFAPSASQVSSEKPFISTQETKDEAPTTFVPMQDIKEERPSIKAANGSYPSKLFTPKEKHQEKDKPFSLSNLLRFI